MVSSMFTFVEREFHAISVVYTSHFFSSQNLNNEEACYFHSFRGNDSLLDQVKLNQTINFRNYFLLTWP